MTAMLRAVLLGVLTLTSVVGCKSEAKSSAQVQPGVAAGKVLEVKGAVTVKHGDASKPLAVGDSVEADDVVSTGADGNVVIELAHNSVRWELGANKTQKVRDSIAFKAEKNTGPTGTVEQDTAAAGRPAERSAVETSATAVDEKEDAEAAKAEAAPAPEPAMAAPPAAAEAAEAPPPPAPERKRSRPSRTRSAAKKEAAPMIPSADAAMRAPREEAAAGPTTRGGTRGPAVVARKIEAPMAPPSAAATATAESAKAAPPPGGGASNQALVTAKLPALKACMAGHEDAVNVSITISGGAPKVTITSKSAVSAALKSCMTNVIKTIKFGADGKASATVKP